MLTTLTICRYPAWAVPFAVLSMAWFRLPLALNRNIRFYKLMGTGKNGTFDKHPEWREWAILTTHIVPPTSTSGTLAERQRSWYGAAVVAWWRFFKVETFSLELEAVEGHGLWDGEQPFALSQQPLHPGNRIAVLTRATIRWSKLGAFWSKVDGVAQQMAGAPGFVTSIGVGEVPYVKQATFSVWESVEAMKAFAYKMADHQDVIRRTRKENWYSEELFMRFRILQHSGTLRGKNPLT